MEGRTGARNWGDSSYYGAAERVVVVEVEVEAEREMDGR